MGELLLEPAVAALRRGGVVAYPTEAVYGLGCDPHDAAALARLFALKRRPPQQGVLLIAADFDQVRRYIALDQLPAAALERVRASWPGPHTWVVPRSAEVPEWIAGGHPPFDLWDVDIRRMMPHQNRTSYLVDRVSEALGLLYAMHWPYRQFETARGVRKTPLYERLKAHNACFGEVAGWERANWFAPEGIEPKYQYSFKRQNWFDYCGEECRATRGDARPSSSTTSNRQAGARGRRAR